MIDISFGVSKNPNVEAAVREASVQLRSKLTLSKVDACLVLFNFPEVAHSKLVSNIKNILNPPILIGRSFPFLIAGQEIFRRGLIIIGFSGITAAAAVSAGGEDPADSSEEFIASILRQVHNKRKKFFLSFSESNYFSAQAWLKGLERVLGKHIPFLDIFSCREESDTFVVHNTKVVRGASVGISFFDGIDVFLDVGSGFGPLGKAGQITSSYRRIVEQINNKPAIHFYGDYFGEGALRSPEYFKKVAVRYPLGFKLPGSARYIVARPVRVSPDGSLVFLKDIPSSDVKLMISTRASLINSLKDVVKSCKKEVRRPKIAFFFDSLFRHKILGSMYSAQLREAALMLGDIPLVGALSGYASSFLKASERERGHFICEHSFSLLLLGEK